MALRWKLGSHPALHRAMLKGACSHKLPCTMKDFEILETLLGDPHYLPVKGTTDNPMSVHFPLFFQDLIT